MFDKVKNWVQRPTKRHYTDLLTRLDAVEAVIDTLLHSPEYRDDDKASFNGQKARKRIFEDLLKTFRFEAILETGTYLGDTTGYMAVQSKLPVYSCDINPRFHALAKMRLSNVGNVSLELCDSREFLRKLIHSDIRDKRIFAYLDAHLYDIHPLAEELGLLVQFWKDFVVMIDDFKVPGDTGYEFDYQYDRPELTLERYFPLFKRLHLVPFFPAAPASEETGSKRGCVILAPKGPITEQLARISSLHPFTSR